MRQFILVLMAGLITMALPIGAVKADPPQAVVTPVPGTAAPAPNPQFYNGSWWYRMPDGRWLYAVNGQWVSPPPPAAAPVSDRAPTQPSPSVPAGESHGLPQDVLQVIRWLPEDTESIMLAQGPLQDGTLRDFHDPLPPISPFPTAGDAPTTAKAGEVENARVIYAGPPTGDSPARGAIAPKPIQQPLPDFRQESLASSAFLFTLSGKAFIRNISTHEVRFVVAAARHFGLPVINSESTYEGCEIIVFRDAVPDVGVQAAARERVSMVQIERNGVVRLDTEERWGVSHDKVTVYFAKPKPSVLIAATNAEFLKTVLQRIAQTPETRTPLLDFPEWKYVDVQSPVWGVRHRRTATPIYILAKTEKGGLPFSELNGISLSYDLKPATCVAWRFHFTEKAQDAVRQAVTERSGTKLVAPSVVENRLGISTQEAANGPGSNTPSSAMFMVQHLMGYVVCP
jgi:hypothetical protein